MTMKTDANPAGTAYDPWHGVDAIRAQYFGRSVETAAPHRPDYDAADPWAPPPVPTPPMIEVVKPVAPLSALAADAISDAPTTVAVPAVPLAAVVPVLPPVPPRDLDQDAVAAQLATLARSSAKLDRARAYADRLGAHAAEVRSRLTAASEHQVAAAIGTAGSDPAEVGPLRGEAVEVDRQHKQALTILADVAAEYARHEADLAALCGVDGAARARLAEAQMKRAAAQTTADDVKAILSRARAHEGAVTRRLEDARADEARHDADAAARLRAALVDGGALPAAAEPFVRFSAGLEDDLRAAQATVAQLAEDHARKGAALDEAERRVRGAVDAVLLAEGEVIAREVKAIDARAILLRGRLSALVGRPRGDYVIPPQAPSVRHAGGWLEASPIPVPPRVVSSTAILSAIEGNPDARASMQDALRETAAWTVFATALAADADADADFNIDTPPRPEPTPSPLPGGRFPASWETKPIPAAPAAA